MKSVLLAATAALLSFGALAQTGPATVAGQTPADGRAYGEAVSTAARNKNGYKKTRKYPKYPKPAKPLTEAEKDAYKAQKELRKADHKASKDAYKDQTQEQKDAYKARKDAYKAQHETRKDADKPAKHDHGARGSHEPGGHGHAAGHAKGRKAK